MSKYRSLESQVHYAVNQIFREGTKKYEFKIENGQGMSEKIFSYNEKGRLLDVAKNIQNFMKENHTDIKLVKDIKADHLQGFLNSKISNCTQNTINSYYASIKKIEKVCEKVFNTKLGWTDKIVIPRSERGESQQRGSKNQMTAEAYDKIEKYIESNKYSQSGQIVLLQKELGLRVNEITQLKVNQIDFRDKEIRLTNTKGGKALTRQLTPRLERLFKEAISQKHHDTKVFSIENKTVNQYLRRTEDKLKLERYSFHNIRAFIAQKYYDTLRSQGCDRKDALQLTSEFLNHIKPRDRMITKSYINIH